MTRIRTAAAMLGTTIALFTGIAAQSERTVWDGVYSKAQAERGQGAYTTACASCHGADLAGGEMAPGLTGGEFQANWSGLTLDQLFERIRTSMPLDRPKSLFRAQVADIVAYVLDTTSFPAGANELPATADTLSAITYAAQKPTR
jgi:quinoprotein glucose dehydrogenase